MHITMSFLVEIRRLYLSNLADVLALKVDTMSHFCINFQDNIETLTATYITFILL